MVVTVFSWLHQFESWTIANIVQIQLAKKRPQVGSRFWAVLFSQNFNRYILPFTKAEVGDLVLKNVDGQRVVFLSNGGIKDGQMCFHLFNSSL